MQNRSLCISFLSCVNFASSYTVLLLPADIFQDIDHEWHYCILQYSWKYWRSLNLAVWSQTECKKFWQNLNMVVSTSMAKPPNLTPHQIHAWHHIVCSWLHIIDRTHCGHHARWTGYLDSRLQTGSVPDHCPFCRQVRLTLPLSWNPGMHLYCATAPNPAPVNSSRASLGGSKWLQLTAVAEKSYNSHCCE